MNLYRYLNDRHYRRWRSQLDKSLEDIDKGIAVTHSWEDLKARWEAEDARRDAQPGIIRQARGAYWTARRLLRNNTPRRVINRIVWYHQRGRRGWSDADSWSLDSYIARVASEGMGRLAARTHSWPGEHSQWPTFEAWQEHLTSMSVRLGAWNSDTFSEKESFEITHKAVQEFAENFGHYWDLSDNSDRC